MFNKKLAQLQIQGYQPSKTFRCENQLKSAYVLAVFMIIFKNIVWEKGDENGRLHFHAIIRIPEGKMIGELFEKRYYDVVNHKMQTTTQNTYFNERFGKKVMLRTT